nr:extensin family protein [uncultured Shimia sp.]
MRRLGIALLLVAGVAQANAPKSSLRPVAREDVFPPALPSAAPDRSLRPKLRPKTLAGGGNRASAASAASAVAAAEARGDPVLKPAPQTSSARDGEPEPKAKRRAASSTRVGKLCRDRDLQGTEVGNVPGRLGGCGIKKGAIKLHSVSGVRLSTPAVMECDTARALKKWVDGGMDKSVGRYGRGVVELKVAAGFACRTRNNRPGAKISEHGKGRAIDISAFKLKNGDTISVLNDWGKGKKGRILKNMHKKACGPFGTVLGPNADRYHRDHFHFDIAKHRGGPYCR